MRIGPYTLTGNLVLAPMAGVTDLAFRRLCRQLGADLCVAEMVSSNPRLLTTAKTLVRLERDREPAPRIVQIAGSEPGELAASARYNVARGAQIIDINMGCPAKKVCRKSAGSALLGDEALVGRILDAVVAAVAVPVTLKIRTGPTLETRNGVRIARLAERAGIAAIAVHGRSRACAFRGRSEHDTTRAIKAAVGIPVIANGDIVDPEIARAVLDYTGADGLMVGRAAQGNPWIFREIRHFLRTGTHLAAPRAGEIRSTLLAHLRAVHALYGAPRGVRVARKHLAWYARARPGADRYWAQVRQIDSPAEQIEVTRQFFSPPSRSYAARPARAA